MIESGVECEDMMRKRKLRLQSTHASGKIMNCTNILVSAFRPGAPVISSNLFPARDAISALDFDGCISDPSLLVGSLGTLESHDTTSPLPSVLVVLFAIVGVHSFDNRRKIILT